MSHLQPEQQVRTLITYVEERRAEALSLAQYHRKQGEIVILHRLKDQAEDIDSNAFGVTQNIRLAGERHES